MKKPRELLHDAEYTLRFVGVACVSSILHPRTPIVFIGNPSKRVSRPLPWLCNMAVILVGVSCLYLSSEENIPSLGELARAMVWWPLANMYNMGLSSKVTVEMQPK